MSSEMPTTGTTKLGPAAERVFRAMQAEIADGRIPSGGRLPTERELGARFAISRITIRKALAKLAQEGWIETRHGSGSHVCINREESRTSNTISVMCGAVPSDLPELTRVALEGGCTLGIYAQHANHYDNNLERIFFERTKQQRHRALLAVCTPAQPRNDDLVAELAASGTKVVHLEPFDVALPQQSYLMPDYGRAGRAAAAMLARDGFRRIICLGLDHDGPCFRLINRGALETLADQGLSCQPADDFSNSIISDANPSGSLFHFLPAHNARYAERLDQLCSLVREPTGFILGSLNRAAEMRGQLALRGVGQRHRFKVIGVEISAEERHKAVPEQTFCFRREDLYLRALKLVADPGFRGVRELLPPILYA